MQKERKIVDLLSDEYFVFISAKDEPTKKYLKDDAKKEDFKVFNGEAGLYVLGADMTIRGIGGWSAQIAYHSARVREGKLVVKIDYSRYRTGKRDYFIGDFALVDYEALIKQKEKYKPKATIKQGSAAFLIYSYHLQQKNDFFDWLNCEGFRLWEHSEDWYPGVNWLYININAKIYTIGIPGMNITEPVGNHAVTISEFKQIYAIYSKYENLNTLVMG